MKRIYKFLLTTFASVAMLSATSCRDDTFDSVNGDQGEYVKVSFTLAPEAASVSTRGDYPSAQYSTGKIGDGGKADMLVYAIYDKDGNILPEYSEGVDAGLDIKGNVEGQTVKKVDRFPYVVNIMLKRGEEYQIAFWAQSSKATKFYNTSNLRKVEVMYNELDESDGEAMGEDGEVAEVPAAPNNDELRDAFCRSVTIKTGYDGSVQQNVYLYRPLAQINVGTAGYDYEIVTRDANVKYTYSKIRINRIARYLDVVADKTILDNSADDEGKYDYNNVKPEAMAVVDFGWAPIPAYTTENIGFETGTEGVTPPYPSYTINDWEYNGYDTSEAYPGKSDMLYSQYENEHFLRVHLDGSDENNSKAMGSGLVRTNWNQAGKDEDGYYKYSNLDNYYDQDSETFKYLSMCYVLTSSTKEEARVINNIKVWVASDQNGSNEKELLNIDHVPVQRNWRTNIVGELLTSENKFDIILDRNFAGDYDIWKDDGQWSMTGPLAPGVFYDATNDVIEISSRDGLLWFQKMVNGTMKVRESAKEDNITGQDYPYYTSDGSDTKFVYEGISEPTDDPLLRERIMIATHQQYNKDAKWPENNNFHFTGTKEYTPEGKNVQATVRLMADIDMGGDEWVPIGFDGRIGEQLGWTVLESETYNVTHNRADNRIFYGIFDGNDHSIYNLTTKRFSASVHKTAVQRANYRTIYKTNVNRHPSDNFQWFGRGLFGQIGGSAKITNVRLSNVDIYGCNGVAGIAGIAYGDDIEISGCIVDGGTIEATPMYRGDAYRSDQHRTFARGVYMGGIVGYFNTDGGKVDNNIVRNLTLKAVRRGAGLIGSINQQYLDEAKTADEGKGLVDGTWLSQRETNPASISNNQLQNLNIIISSFTAYGEKLDYNGDVKDEIVKSGFGFNNGNLEMYSQKFVGGFSKDADARDDISGIFKNNTENNVTLSLLQIGYNKDDEYQKFFDGQYQEYNKYVRIGRVESLPLKEMPMLSSWYSDYIYLTDNYYGTPSAHPIVQLHDFQYFSEKTKKSGYTNDNTNFNNNGNVINGGTNFYYPMNLPFDVKVDYKDQVNNPNAGVFVESVTLDGSRGVGGRSVITPTNVTGDDDCVMYITARNRHQFGQKNIVWGTKSYVPEYIIGYEDENPATIKIPTRVWNVVLRGEPYATTGILLAPNKNMHRVELKNVAIYDVYKTMALFDWITPGTPYYTTSQMVWPNMNGSYDALNRSDTYASTAVMPHIIMDNCNLRGYTVPGALWRYVNCNNTTFEQGANTGHGVDEYTYKVETTTNFNNCIFKAPYIIDMQSMTDLSNVTFTGCQGTAANSVNVRINYTNDLRNQGCNRIMVKRDSEGKPYVEYYKGAQLLKTDTL